MKLVVVDIQPEYEDNATFDIGDMLRSAAEDYSSILFLFNGEDTVGMISEGELKNYYFEKLDYDEEVFDELLSKSEFFDKGYGFFRDVMDSSVCFDRNQIVKIVKYMLDNDFHDLRELSEEDVEAIGVNELLFDDLEDYGFHIPDLSEVLPNWSGSALAGGARDECMAEVEILGAAQGLSFNHVDNFIYEGEKRYTGSEPLAETYLREYIREILAEGRNEAETTQISRDIVDWVKTTLSKGLPQDKVPTYKRGYPFHDLGIKMFDTPSTVKDRLNRLTATIKVDPELEGMKKTYDVAGKAGSSDRGTLDLQVQIYLRKDFTLQDMNNFIADLKQTIIHELEHLGQSEEVLDTALPEDGRSYDWNKMSGLRNYYSSQAELEAYAKGAFKKAKVKGITFPESIDEKLNSTMELFISRYNKHVEAGVEDRLDYNEQDLRDYFQKELRDQILDIARKKYPKALGLNESRNTIAMGQCYPFAVNMAKDSQVSDRNDLKKFKVVHGIVTDKFSGDSYDHAWVEMGNTVFDDQTKFTKPDGIPKGVYYDLYQPNISEEYTAAETIMNCVSSGHAGPWT